jgi:tetratricopeptide (TPR) repeat protein
MRDRRYLIKEYDLCDKFGEFLEEHLARWLTQHESLTKTIAASPLASGEPAATRTDLAPGFEYWLGEAKRLLNIADPQGALFCATRATEAANSDVFWANAANLLGNAYFSLGRLDDAIGLFSEIVNRFNKSVEPDRSRWLALALFNKGATFGTLNRNEEAIAVYDDLIARFATATEPALREGVAKALVNKGVTLGALHRSDEEIAVYDDLIARFATATEPALREQIAKALLYKGITLGAANRSDEAIAVYDDLIGRFADAEEVVLTEILDRAKSAKEDLQKE